MTIGNELAKLKETRQNMINAINDQGQSVGQNDTFVSMIPKIKAIDNTGGIQYLLKEIIEGTVEEINDTSCTILRSNCLQRCNLLKTARFTVLVKICSHAFDSCVRFDTLILDTETKVYLENPNAFRYTPIESGSGTIYVTDSLLNDYLNDEQWGHYASQIVGISTLN